MSCLTAGDAKQGDPSTKEDAKLIRAQVAEECHAHDGNWGRQQ